jgi:SprT protein
VYETSEEIDALFKRYVDLLHVEKRIIWIWNERAINRAGCAHLADRCIELSRKTWKASSDAERKETAVHELCHIVAWDRHRERGHGVWWKLVMAEAGYPRAKRCHAIDTSKLTLHKKWPLFCDCKCHMVSRRYYNSVVNKTKRARCIKCKGPLRREME